MRWFREKPRRLNLGRFVAPEPVPEVPVSELVEEAVLIAGAGVRLAVKNVIILRSLRDRVDFDESVLAQAVREELSIMADEKLGDAHRLATLHAGARQRPGQPEHQSDYRFVDVDALQRREDVARAVADRLRELSTVDHYVRSIVDSARVSAWDEIAASLKHKLLLAARPVDKHYARYRDARVAELLGDLADLEAGEPW